MRRWIVISSVIVVLALLAGVGYFGLGWWQPSHATIRETAGGTTPKASPPRWKTPGHRTSGTQRDRAQRTRLLGGDRQAGANRQGARRDRDVRQDSRKALQRLPQFPRLAADDKSVKGREVIYVQGRNDDKLLVHTPGFRTQLGNVSLGPKGYSRHAGRTLPDHRDRPGQPLPATDPAR